MASANFTLHSTVGEPGAAASAGGGFRLQAGFMPLASQPGAITAITALSKSTGTLDLAWTAPGRDGAVAGVTNGFYRIDYSSDPSHAFSPTVYQDEFSTTVAPGQAQFRQLTGLQPNTTYYMRIYLADERKVFAEDSSADRTSTLANVPIDPVIAEVSEDAVIITWSLPANGAASFLMQGSSTNFGPSGAVFSSATCSGLLASLTMSGLSFNTTYYFKVASLNWQGDPSYTVILSTLTLGRPLSVSDIVVSTDAVKRRVTLTWHNPWMANPKWVVVMLSTSTSAPALVDGTQVVPGQTLGDASVVRSTTWAESLDDSGLALDTTYYYHLYTQNSRLFYSFVMSMSTSIFLDLHPMEAAGLTAQRSPNRTQFILSWKPVTSNEDGSLFASTASPRESELKEYEIYRATSVLYANWGSTPIKTVPFSSMTFTDSGLYSTMTYIYRIRAKDSRGKQNDGMAIDTDQNLYAFANDNVTHFKVPAKMRTELLAETNRHSADIVIRAKDLNSDPANKIMRAARFTAYKLPGNETVDSFELPAPEATVALRYETAGSQVVGYNPASAQGASGAPSSPENLGLYWYNGSRYLKLFGAVNTADQTVAVQAGKMGEYQIRNVARSQGFNFDISQITNKMITPNGDGLNDTTVFIFDNPNDSGYSGRIFDVRGGMIADMSPGPVQGCQTGSLKWDGKANGAPVSGGVYIYQIRAEDKVFNGTILVIR